MALFASLTLAGKLARVLGQSPAGGVLFGLGCLLVLLAVMTQGLKARPRGLEIGVALGVVAAYILVFVRISVPAERTHLIEYGVLALLLHEALLERARNGRRAPVPWFTAMLLTASIGVLDELVQGMLPSRVRDPRDMGFNALAAVMAVTANASLSWVRRRSRR